MSMIERQHTFIRAQHAARMSPTQALVWIVLNDHSDGEGRSWPATETIAAELGHQRNATTGRADTKAVRRALTWLQAHGYVQMIEAATFRRPAVYRVLLPAGEGSRELLETAPATEGTPPTVGTLPTLDTVPTQSGQCAPPTVGNAPRPQWAHCPPKMTLKSTEKSTHTPREGAFDRFWKTYPAHKRIGEPAARSLWIGLALDDELDEILAGLERWRRSPAWTRECGRYVPRPLAWLTDRAWTCDPSPGASASTPAASPPPAAGISIAELSAERERVDQALAELDALTLQSLKGEVIRASGDAGKTFEPVDPADQRSPRAWLLRLRIADLLRRRSSGAVSGAKAAKFVG